jgi:hypothetical protein
MKTTHFLSQLLLSAICLPTFLSAELLNLENETQNRLGISTSCSDSSHHSSKKSHDENVFASYRNSEDQTILAGGKVLFNEKNANKGDGIHYHDGTFTIKKSGFYLINYGLASIGNAGEVGAAFGFDLIRTRDCQRRIMDSVLTDSSSAIILFLKEHDKIKIVSQKFLVHLIAGSLPPRTTSLTDTAHISFLRINR